MFNVAKNDDSLSIELATEAKFASRVGNWVDKIFDINARSGDDDRELNPVVREVVYIDS